MQSDKLPLKLTLILAPCFLGASLAVAGNNQKVDVCHVNEYGLYHLINISTKALPAHLAHGDGLPGDPVPGMTGKKFAEDCTIVDACPVVTAGEVTGFTTGAGLRIKGAPGPDVYLGVGDLGQGGNRVQADAGNPLADGTYPLTFAFNATDNAISLVLVNPTNVNLAYDFDDLLSPGCPTTSWNAMVITVRDSKDNGGAGLQNVMLGACPLGNFAPPDGTPNVLGTPGFQYWTVTGFDFSQSFNVGTNLAVNNLNANESLKVEIRVGCAP